MTLSKEAMDELSTAIVKKLEASRSISNEAHIQDHVWIGHERRKRHRRAIFIERMKATTVGSIIVIFVGGILGYLALIGKKFFALVN